MNNTKKKNVIDLFCGCGGLSLGFSMAGYEVLLGIDNNRPALETFKKNHGHSRIIHADIEQVTKDLVLRTTGHGEIDVIAGGPPCQGVSISGPRQFDDRRNTLFMYFVKTVASIKPKVFVLENVPGLVGLFNGRFKDALIREFRGINYNVFVRVLLAANYGVPQMRRRVFFVGLRDPGIEFVFRAGSHTDEETFFNDRRYICCGDALSDLPSLVNELGMEKQKYGTPPKNDYQKLMREKSKFIYNHIATNHTARVREIIRLVPEGGNHKHLPPGLARTRNFHVAWTRFDSKKPAPTIDTGHRHHFHYKYDRVPTVRECARLQSFPDRFIFCGNKSQQYSQVGNAVPPLLARALAEEIKKCL